MPGVILVSHQVSIISVNNKYSQEEDQLSVPTFLQFPSDAVTGAIYHVVGGIKIYTV